MHFLINELSFIGQAQNFYEATELMRYIAEILKAIQPLQGIDPIYTHSSFFQRPLSDKLSVYDWAQTRSADTRDIRVLFIKLTTKEPFIERILDILNVCKCEHYELDVSSSSLAGAAHLQGILISLQKTLQFEVESVRVKFCTDEILTQEIDIPNIIRVEQIQKLRRQYMPTAKHQKGGWGTLMDLSDEIAQKVLDSGIDYGKQVYGYYDGMFYEFQPDGVGGFHGYPIARSDVPDKALKALIKDIV